MPDNNEWKVPSVFTEICELRKECHDLHNENADLHKRNDCQAQQLSSLRDDLGQANRDRDKAMNMAEDRQRRMENAEKEVERLIGIAKARAQRITNLENALKRPGDEDPFSDKAQVKGLEERLANQAESIGTLLEEVAHFKALAEERERLNRGQKVRISLLEAKRPGDADSHLAPSPHLSVQLLEGTTKGVNGLHAVGQVIGHLQLSRKDTRNIGHWLINSVKAEEEL